VKYLDLDWAAALGTLAFWPRLPVPAREVVLRDMKPSQGVLPERLGDGLQALLASGYVETGAGRQLVPRGDHRALHLALRAMYRRRVWDAPGRAALLGYLEEHLDSDDLLAQVPGGTFWSTTQARDAVADAVSDEEWIGRFLAVSRPSQALEWERGRLRHPRKPSFGRPEVWEATRTLVRALLAARGPVPLLELPGRFPAIERGVLGAALSAALRHLLLFAAIRGGDLVPVVGAWPEIAERWGAPPPSPPAPVQPRETFEAAWLMEDLTTVMVAVAGEPVRLRGSDGAVFARAREAIQPRLLAVPPWVAHLGRLTPEDRVEHAAALLRHLRFAKEAGTQGTDLRLQATKKGTEWLALGDRERLAALLDVLRGSAQRNPPGWYEHAEFGFFPLAVNMRLRAGVVDARAALERLLLAQGDGFVPLTELGTYAGRAANPFLDAIREGKQPADYGWNARQPTRREWESAWADTVIVFAVHRLAALGGARLGFDGSAFSFALTPAGRYLLGGADTFDYGGAGDAQVVVQPDFEIVFLAPAPRVEAQLARVAERVGPGPGVMFRLTRASVLAAAEGGMGAEQVVEMLAAASSRPLPANVQRQVRDWMGAVRRVRVRPALLVECPDAETAARVRAAGGAKVREITPTLLELTDASRAERAALAKKLRAGGVFVSDD
jgi:hypothetical protein